MTIFDKNNKLITHFGDNPEVWKSKGWPNIPHEMRETGKFVSPHAACWDARRKHLRGGVDRRRPRHEAAAGIDTVCDAVRHRLRNDAHCGRSGGPRKLSHPVV